MPGRTGHVCAYHRASNPETLRGQCRETSKQPSSCQTGGAQGPQSWVWPLSWTLAWVRPPENWRNRRCRVRIQNPESSAKGHCHVEKPLQPVQGLALTGSHPGHLALKMTLSALAFRSPPDTSTTERCFHFGPASSFFLELLVIALCSFSSCSVSSLTPSDWGWGVVGRLLVIISFCLCILFMGFSW